MQKVVGLVPGNLLSKIVASRHGRFFVAQYAVLAAGQKPRIYRIHNSVNMELDLSKDGERGLPLNAFEPWTTEKVLSILTPNATVLDIGAWIGYYTVIAASRVGNEGRVIAVEPSKSNVERIARNVTLNGFQNVTIINAAIGEHESEGKLLEDEGSLYHRITNDGGSLTKIRKLDNLIKELNISKVDLIIMDIEGFEILALRGLKETLSSCKVENLICEIHPIYIKANDMREEEVFEILNDSGFETEIIDRMGTVYHIFSKKKNLHTLV